MATLLLLSFQVTISGFQSDENSNFSVLINLAEEENEDSETESVQKTNESDSLVPVSMEFFVHRTEQLGHRPTQMNLGSGHVELSSPPPEA